MNSVLHVVVATPAHSAVGEPLSYRSELPLAPGSLVRVPLGRREVCGVVWDTPTQPGAELAADQVRKILGPLEGLPPLNAAWRELVAFSSGY